MESLISATCQNCFMQSHWCAARVGVQQWAYLLLAHTCLHMHMQCAGDLCDWADSCGLWDCGADSKVRRWNVNQRAANGGLDPSWLDLAFARIFSPEVPKYPFLKGFGTSGRKNAAPQKRQIQPPILGPLSVEQGCPPTLAMQLRRNTR